MKNALEHLQINSIHKTNNCGPLRVISHSGTELVQIEMVNTGHKATVRASKINSGSIKDPLYKSVYGTGFIGAGKKDRPYVGSRTKAYTVWSDMMERCYSRTAPKHHPAYKDCTVCNEWHDFQVFAVWFEVNYIEGLQIDKDIRVEGNRIYSPDTCKFVTLRENVVKAQAKNYTLINPIGLAVDVYNLAQFCRDNGLPRGNMARMICGVTKTCMGWSL